VDVAFLVSTFAFGAAALALWVHVRFPSLAPETLRAGIAHLVLAIVIGQLAMVPLGALLDPSAPQRTMSGLFGLGLPVLVYSFIAGLWMLRLCQRMLGGAVR